MKRSGCGRVAKGVLLAGAGAVALAASAQEPTVAYPSATPAPPPGYGTPPPPGYGAAPPQDYGAPPSSGYGAAPPQGYGGTPTQGYGATPQYAPPPGAYGAPAQSPPATPAGVHPVRDLFAGTISAVLSAVGGGVATSLAQGVAGGIAGWFDRKARRSETPVAYGSAGGYPPGTQAPGAYAYPQGTTPSSGYGQGGTAQGGYAQGGYAQGAYPPGGYAQGSYAQGGYAPGSSTSSAQGATSAAATPAYPATAYPTDASGAYAGTYPSDGSVAYAATAPAGASAWSATPVYDPRTGQLDTSQGAYPAATADATLYAGIAYEVHALGAGGMATPVNAATYDFRTGDQFRVLFRPSLPGRLDVYNINPLGQQTRIDSLEVAAGQLTTLGPYEFAATRGDESLRLVLSPCASPQLIATTRDIVNVAYSGAPPPAAASASHAGLGACSAVGTRSVRTRDIRRVAVDGTTSFALDPVAASELSSGQLSAREVTIRFRHR